MSPHSPEAALARRTLIVAGIVLAMVAIALILYFAASAFFVVFAGLVLAAILDGFSRLPQRAGAPRKAALAIVFLVTVLAFAALAIWGGAALAAQASELASAVRRQAEDLLRMLSELGLPINVEEMDPTEVQNLLPEPAGVVSTASSALFSIVGGVGNFVIIIFLGAFIAWQPRLYRDGLVSLFTRPKRARINDTLGDCAHALRMWLAGSAISMATVFVVSWAGLGLIGMPFAFLLALQAGLLAFIPTLGPAVAGIPIVLTGLSESPQMALWGLAVYVLIQAVESNVTTPIAQRWTTALPPALTLSVQLVFGILFGLPGLILAVPLVAVLVVLVRDLYVEDVLGGPVESLRED